MSRRRSPLKLAAWLAIVVMLLRLAVPLLAVGAAQLRGVAVGSICTVYGVVLADAAGSAHAGHQHAHAEHAGHAGHQPGSHEAHTGDHCALTALAELGGSGPPALGSVVDVRHAVADLTLAAPPARGDASATWIAQRKQGPPRVA